MYYLYDGVGRRVQEVSTYNVEKVFVYDAFGQMAAEYSIGAQSLPCTTTTSPNDFEPVRGTSAKKNEQTGEIFQLDRFHKDHYEVY